MSVFIFRSWYFYDITSSLVCVDIQYSLEHVIYLHHAFFTNTFITLPAVCLLILLSLEHDIYIYSFASYLLMI